MTDLAAERIEELEGRISASLGELKKCVSHSGERTRVDVKLVEGVRDTLTDCLSLLAQARRVEELEEALKPLVAQFDAYRESDGSHADAHNILVRYPLWEAARSALNPEPQP